MARTDRPGSAPDRRPASAPPDALGRVVPPQLSLVPRPGEEAVRWPRVTTARARIAAGYYERPEVMTRLADALLKEIEPE